MRDLVVPAGACGVADEGRCGAPYPVRVGISGLATAPVASCSGGSGGQDSRSGQHLGQPCPDHSLDVTRQGLEVDGEPDPLSATYP